jgi:hypothetical protein
VETGVLDLAMAEDFFTTEADSGGEGQGAEGFLMVRYSYPSLVRP